MPDISTSNFVSRSVDTVSLRRGRSEFVYLRQIILKDSKGNPSQNVCLVEMPSDKTSAVNELKLQTVMQLLEDGLTVHNQRKQSGLEEARELENESK